MLCSTVLYCAILLRSHLWISSLLLFPSPLFSSFISPSVPFSPLVVVYLFLSFSLICCNQAVSYLVVSFILFFSPLFSLFFLIFLFSSSFYSSHSFHSLYSLHSIHLFLLFLPSILFNLALQGDVGGGHYYAYIRPNGTMGFDYETFAAHGQTNTPIQESDPKLFKNNISFPESKNSNEKEKETKKDLLDRKARDGQWFKFNDEFVLKVSYFHLLKLQKKILLFFFYIFFSLLEIVLALLFCTASLSHPLRLF